jgi:hypothetical protein
VESERVTAIGALDQQSHDSDRERCYCIVVEMLPVKRKPKASVNEHDRDRERGRVPGQLSYQRGPLLATVGRTQL